MTNKSDIKTRKIRSFILRGGRLSKLQQHSIDTYYDTYCIPYNEKILDYKESFCNGHPVIIEIGFGMGITTAKIAHDFPENNYLGIEVHRPGIGKLLSEITRYGLENVRIIEHDAVEVLETMIQDGSVDGFHIFFPDPWQKKRHHKRRLIQDAFVDLLTRKLKQGGYLYSVTDWDSYAEQMLDVYTRQPLLHNTSEGFSKPISWRPETRFEGKGIKKDHKIQELWVEKV